MSNIINGISSFFKDKLAHRLSIYFISIAIFCSVCVVIIASYIQCQRDTLAINKEAKQVVNAIEREIIDHLWNLDEDSLTLLLEGINKLPVVGGIHVSNTFERHFTFGHETATTVIDKPLIYKGENIGTLKAYANNRLAVHELRSNIIVHISFGAALVFILMGFVFFIIVKKTITDHLSTISEITMRPEYYQQQEHFSVTLNRKTRNDELSDLVNALNIGLDKSRELAHTQRDYKAELHKQAYIDDLTNMPNRRDADQYIAQKIKAILTSTHSQHLMIFFIDLDSFKEINDSFGHTIGDHVLLESSRRFKKIMKKYGGYIARFGGDEFVGCVDCESRSNGELIAQDLINEINCHFTIEDMTLMLSCSMGVVFCPEHAASAEDVIRKADAAMYRAKEMGRNGYVVYDDQIMDEILFRSNIKQRIKKALTTKNLLQVHYQPLINIKENKIVGFEALLRWKDDILGDVSPGLFVPIAENSGLIFDIDIMVFDDALAQVSQWRKTFTENYKVSVNFSPTNFENNRITQWLKETISSRDDLDWVEMEVTERLMLGDDPAVRKSLEKIVGSGVRLSLDDFGTGFSSLGYIKKFSQLLSKIKIDRLFVNELTSNDADFALVKSIITMAESLGIEWLAEGVETQAQLDKLSDLGCTLVQGFYYAKPMCANDAEVFIAKWQEEHA